MTIELTEAAIESARELLLMLHTEVRTGATLTTDAVAALMTELDTAIFAWDSAADAAAPAVGVDDDRNPIDILFEFGSLYHRWIQNGKPGDLGKGLMHALERLGATETIAKLTAQPEPGTHDAGCPICHGRGWIEEPCPAGCGDDDDAGHVMIPAKPEGWKP